MEQHDVVMECTRYTLLENGDKSDQNPSTWSNSNGSSYSSALGNFKIIKYNVKVHMEIL